MTFKKPTITNCRIYVLLKDTWTIQQDILYATYKTVVIFSERNNHTVLFDHSGINLEIKYTTGLRGNYKGNLKCFKLYDTENRMPTWMKCS